MNIRFKSSYMEPGDLKQMGLFRNTGSAMVVGKDNHGSSVKSGLATGHDEDFA